MAEWAWSCSDHGGVAARGRSRWPCALVAPATGADERDLARISPALVGQVERRDECDDPAGAEGQARDVQAVPAHRPARSLTPRRVCALLGGGGHAAAAGASLHGALGEVERAVLQAIDIGGKDDGKNQNPMANRIVVVDKPARWTRL